MLTRLSFTFCHSLRMRAVQFVFLMAMMSFSLCFLYLPSWRLWRKDEEYFARWRSSRACKVLADPAGRGPATSTRGPSSTIAGPTTDTTGDEMMMVSTTNGKVAGERHTNGNGNSNGHGTARPSVSSTAVNVVPVDDDVASIDTAV